MPIKSSSLLVALIIVIVGRQCICTGCINSCNSGEYLVLQVDGNGTGQCVECPSGFFCEGNQSAPQPCPPGSANQVTGQINSSACQPCLPGTYAGQVGSTSCLPCPSGTFCPNSSASSPTPCGTGFYAVLSGDVGATACTECPFGAHCPFTFSFPIPCVPGFYSNETRATNCTQCPAGHQCTDPILSPEPCIPGFFATAGSTNCILCPPGTACPQAATEAPQPCSAGQYSNNGSCDCSPCPVGHFCPDPVLTPIACPTGMYNNATGQISCVSCETGHQCLGGIESLPCPAGTFSMELQVDCTPCDIGTYSMEGASQCVVCPSGHYCSSPGALPLPCQSGYVAIGGQDNCTLCANGLVPDASQSSCVNCPAGHYCPVPGQPPLMCPNGTYTLSGPSIECTLCPQGYSCPQQDLLPQICSIGSYSPSGSMECLPCPAGAGCLNGSLPDPCVPGEFSLLSDPICTPCPPGFFCSSTSDPPSLCPSGTYSTLSSLSCSYCPPGNYCPTTTMSPLPCPNGTYSADNFTTCQICQAGFACLSPSLEPLPCDSGYYSSAGDIQCSLCPPGFQCPLTDQLPESCPPGYISDRGSTNCTQCPPGHSCPDPTSSLAVFACSPGTYSPGGQTACTTCPEGMYCPDVSSPTEFPCEPGSFSLGNQTSCTPCPPGMACPASDGSSNVFCAPGTYSTARSTTCVTCPPGFACPLTDQALEVPCQPGTFSVGMHTDCIICPPGMECPFTDRSTMASCVAGHYSTGNQSSCTPCPPGYECPSTTTDTMTFCLSGQYSLGGAASCSVCPSGSACSSPNALPIPCAPGTYSMNMAVNCTPCDAGHTCQDPAASPVQCPLGMWSPSSSLVCQPCDLGYQCPKASTTPTPIDGICPIGGWCDGRDLFQCPVGFYGNITGAGSQQEGCVICPPGFYCPSPGSTSFNQNVCPEGFYCPAGTTFSQEFPCPPGRFNNQTMQTSIETGCSAICPRSFYCPQGSSRGLECPAGFYCADGTPTAFHTPCPLGTYGPSSGFFEASQCIDCPAGYYCPSGNNSHPTVSPLPCRPGTYNPLNGTGHEFNCLLCTAGMSCPMIALTEPSHTCNEGHYCPNGTIYPSQHPCLPGTFTFRTDLQSPEQCTICPAGQACGFATGFNFSQPLPCAQGHYCPLGTPAPNKYPCPPGTFTASSNLTFAIECSVCLAGHYCIGGGAGPTDVCPRGHYCPEGTSLPHQFPCPKAMYNSLFGQNSSASCLNCTSGHFCESGFIAPEACPAGTYVPFGFDTASDSTIGDPISNKSDCLACPGGQFCRQASIIPVDCGLGFFSPPGSESCFTCIVGHYCDENATSEANMRLNKQCPPGNYCVAGLSDVLESILCTTGFYCPQGTSKEVPCPPGTYNPLEGQSALSDCLSCSAGFYCLENATLPTGPCEPGFYCPTNFSNGQLPRNIGSYGPTQVPCPGGTYQENFTSASLSDCVECPQGSFCVKGSSMPAICPMGFYCIAGLEAALPCPVGTIGNNTGLISIQGCVLCPPGQYCDAPGLTSPRAPCDPGFVCYLGANTSTPTDGVSGEVCPTGGYCPLGSSTSLPCPPGTFSNTSGSTNTFDCTECTPGFYCSNARTPEPTGPCNAGYYCPGGAQTPNDTVTMAGHYTPVGSAAPVPCDVGTWMPHTAAPECYPCTPGHYCPDHGSTNVTLCPIGHYCEQRSFAPTPCPPGTYSNQTGLASVIECLACPPGQFCASVGLTAPEGLCMAGFACFGNSSLPNPIASSEVTFGDLCIAGHYCPEGSGGGIPCPIGTFSSSRGLAARSECTPCPPAMHCNTSGLTAPSGSCDAGYFCIGGAISGSPTDVITGDVCPIGHFCIMGSSAPTLCLSGTYANSTGLGTCLTCPPSHFCHLNSTVQPEICPAGFYCPGGNGLDFNACPVGTLGTRTGLADVAECVACTGGHYCNSEALTTPSGLCDPGYFCSLGATIPRPLDSINNGPCPSGFYCPLNSSSPTPCPPGTYSPSMFNTAERDCLLCDPGRHCNQSGLVAISGMCTEGYFCLNGSSTAFPLNSPFGDICPTGHFCPQGSSAPIQCLPGTYTNVTGSGICSTCLAGFYCEGTTSDPTSFPCPSGHYCPEGTQIPTQFPCSPSTYNPNIGSNESSACLLCPAGFFCNGTGINTPSGTCNMGSFCVPGSTSPTGQPCQPGFYCPVDVNSPLSCTPGMYCAGLANTAPTGPCDPGYYCISGASSPQPVDGVVGDTCPMGHYCIEGSVNFTACPPGTFGQVLQARNQSEGCELCPATMFCSGYGLTSPSGVCSGGYFCPPGQIVANPFDFICPQGHFCLSGTLEPMRCPSATYQDELGQASCKICPASFFCDNRFEPVVFFNNSLCPLGYYCPNGTAFATEFPCPNGTFSNLTGLIDSSECLPCTPGHYCNQPGLTEPSGLCVAGYFCPFASSTPTPIDFICPPGHYCPIGSINPIPCPAGTYSDSILSHNITSCILCNPGHYCPEGSVNGTALVCDPGFVCLFGAFVPNPNDNTTGYACPVGHFCRGGALIEEACIPGSYQPNTGQSQCIVCPVGALCQFTAQLDFIPCPPGHYCPLTNSTEGTPCPVGTYSNSSGNTNITNCLFCPSGMYCEAVGLLSPTGLCSAGFICVSGSTSIAPSDGVNNPCPIGFYCDEGTPSPQPCPAGTIAPFNNAFLTNDSSYFLQFICLSNDTLAPQSAIGLQTVNDCLSCPGGFYCQFLNSTLPTGPCSPGYYCPHNASVTVSTPAEYACPPGHFCIEGSITPTPCLPGTFSSIFGASNCTICPAGSLCIAGSVMPQTCPPHSYCLAESSEPIFCPNGTFTTNDTFGLSSPDQCTPCIAGHFCLAGDIVGECIAGHLCYQGSAVPNPDGSDQSVGELCPEGFYCLQGAVNATSCPLGLFNVQRGGRQVEDCTDCPPGRMCSGNVATLCFPGFYCISGTANPCPPGTYNPLEGASVISDCISCEQGYLCPNESTVTFLHNPCPLGHYCLSGSIVPAPCPRGTHRNETAAANVSDCYPCPPQFHCPENTTIHPTPCNISEICLAGTITPSPCPAGFYCPQTDLQLPCPPGYFCPEASSWFIECPRDHYCAQPFCPSVFIIGAGANRPEICPLGYREILNLGENFTRSSLQVTCEPCPSGTYMNASSLTEDRVCSICPEGYFCIGGSIFGDPGLTPLFNASLCPVGHYCEAGSPQPTACGTGTFNSAEGQSNASVCIPCPLDTFNHRMGQRACFNCSSEASTLTEGAVECVCTGANRRFQPSDGRCPCRAGFIQYESRIDGDCQRIVYPLCREDQIRSQNGVCRTLPEWVEFCNNTGCRSTGLFVELDRNRGVCVCRTQPLEDVCDSSCQQSNLNRFQIRCNSPPVAVITDVSGNETLIELSQIPGLFLIDLCGSLDGSTITSFTVDTAGNGFRGNYLPDAASLVLLLSPITTMPSSNITSSRRKRQVIADATTQPQFNGIDDPLVCLQVNQSLFFTLSNGSYPVYDEHNLLNKNPDADLGPFNQLVEEQQITGENSFFLFRFTQSGVFSFYLSNAVERYMYIRVVEPSSQCPVIGPFLPASPSGAVQLGIMRTSNIVQDPNWALIGGLLGGGFTIMVATVIALLLFRKFGWSKPVLHKPRYRKSNKRLNMDVFSSKGSALIHRRKLHPMQQLVGGAVSSSAMLADDDFWDYNNQVDLEAFSTKELYSKLADQSHQVVATIGGQKEQARTLYQKLQSEAESLRELWVAKLNLKGRAELASPEELREYEILRDRYTMELDRRKMLGQQFGDVLTEQLSLLQTAENQRQYHRVQCDSLYAEIRATLSWLRNMRLTDNETSQSEIIRLDTHIKTLLNQLTVLVDSHCTQFGLHQITNSKTGARLVSMETGQLLSAQQIREALTHNNESIAIRDEVTGLIIPGDSTRICLPSGSTQKASSNIFVDLTSGCVYTIHGNVLFDPESLKLVTIRNYSAGVSDNIESLIPYIPYPMNPETREPIHTGLEPLEHQSQLKLGGPMKDPTTGLCVPICAITIHPKTKTLLPIGGTHNDPLTGLLVPIDPGSIMIDPATDTPVPILGVDFHPQTWTVGPVGGSTTLQWDPKILLVGEEFVDPLSELIVPVSAAIFGSDEHGLTPVAGTHQAFLDYTELTLQMRLIDLLGISQDLIRTIVNEQQEYLLTEKNKEIEMILTMLMQASFNSQRYWLKTFHNLEQRISSCEHLAQTGGSPCYMEHSVTGQQLPLLLGMSIHDPVDNLSTPILGYEISSVTGIGKPLAGTMDAVDANRKVAINIGERIYSEGDIVPIVGALRDPDSGVVIPVPQDSVVFSKSLKKQAPERLLQLFEREMASRRNYWRWSDRLVEDMKGCIDSVSRSVQTSGPELTCETNIHKLETAFTSSKKLAQTAISEKRRQHSTKSELTTRLPPRVSQLITKLVDDEVEATETHASSHKRFVEVTEKLMERINKEKKSLEAKIQQAKEANNPEAERQLAQNHAQKMATLSGELKQQLLTQRQLLYQNQATLEYLRNKSELYCQVAKGLLTSEIEMPSASVGYSSLSDASVINDGSEKLVPLVERLVHLVEDKGADILVDEEQEESEVFSGPSRTSVVSQFTQPLQPIISQPMIPIVNVEEVQPEEMAGPQTGSPENKPSLVNGLGVPVLSQDMNKVAKQMTERHTIENVNLERKLKEKENAALKKLYAKIEERKTKIISESQKEAEEALSSLRPEDKEKVILRKMKELQDKLDELEEEKNELVGTTLDKLVKQRVQEKNELFKAHHNEAREKHLSSHLVDSAPPSSDELLQDVRQLAEQEERLRAEISLEIAREEEERLKREEILKQATMSRHIVQKLESLEANQDKIKHQQEEMSKLYGALSDRQNNLKTRVSSIINERGRFVRKSRSAGLPIQGRANNALVEVTLSAIAKQDAFKTMKDHGREALLYLGSDKPEMIEVLKDYEENEFLDHKDRDITVDRKEAVAAMKAAQWRLQLEIKKDQKQREQLKLSQSKQAHVSGYGDTDLDISDTTTDKILSQKERQELLDKQINDQVEVDLRHKKELSELEKESEYEESSTLAKQSEHTAQLMKDKLKEKEEEFQQQLASRQGQLSIEESSRMIAEHQREMAALKETMNAEQEQQKKLLSNKIAERKKKKAEKLAEKQKLEMDKLLLDQATSREQLEQEQRKDVEKEMLNQFLKDKDPDKIESIIYHVLKQRHFEETVQLASQYEREKDLDISERKSQVAVTREKERNILLAEQEEQMIDLVNNIISLSNADLSRQKLELKKQHKKQLAEFDKATQEAKDKISSKSNPEKELKYNTQVLALREKQIKELAQVISEFSPEQALVKSYEAEAERAAAEAERFRQEIIESREQKIAKLKEERRQKEESRRKEREAKLKELEAEIEREKMKDIQRQEQLAERYTLMQEQRLAQQEAMHKSVLDKNAGITDQERQKLIDEHKETMKRMLDSMEQEKKRQIDRLKTEIKRRRDKKEQKHREQLEVEEARAVQADDEEEQRRVDEVNTEEARQLQTKLEQTRRPRTPSVVSHKNLPPPDNQQPDITFEQKHLSVPQSIATLGSESDINQLIMTTPLFSQLSEIEKLLQIQLVSSQPSVTFSTSHIDVRDAQWDCVGELVAADARSLEPVEFVVYRFGVFASSLLQSQNRFPEVTLLLATNLPPNNYSRNCFRNSFFYDYTKKILFVRKERLESVGEFVLVVLHCLSHIKCNDLTDDSNPLFQREFYAAIRTLCQEFFFSRVNQPILGRERNLKGVAKMVTSWDDPDHTVRKLINLNLPAAADPNEKNIESKIGYARPSTNEDPMFAQVTVPGTNWIQLEKTD